MKKIILAILLFSSLGLSAQTARTKAQLDSMIVQYITSNNNREITGAQLRMILRDIVASDLNFLDDLNAIEGIRLVIEAGDFSGNNYTNMDLADLTPEIDFAVFANDGAGTKVRFMDGYTFNTTMGRITIPSGPGSYYITIFNP